MKLSTEQEAARDALLAPDLFARHFLQSDVWDTQAAILRSIGVPHSRTAVKACHSSSKTFSAACAVLWFLARFQEALAITTAPTWEQVKKALWGEIHSACSRSLYPFPAPLQTELHMGPKRFAYGLSTAVTNQDEGVKFQGGHAEHVLVVMDEAPGIDPKIWDAIEGIRAGGDVRVLALGNPTIASGPFHEAFKTRTGWSLFTISAFDTPNLQGIKHSYRALNDKGQEETRVLGTGDRELMSLSDEEIANSPRSYLTTRRWVKEKIEEWGVDHSLFESRVLGQFPSQSEDALLSLAWLEAAKARPVSRSSNKLRAGLDVAGPGEDDCVLCIRDGPGIVDLTAWPDADPRGQIVAKLNEFGGAKAFEKINVDSAGIGYYVAKHLRDLGFRIVEVNVGESPRNTEKFANLKAELYWGLRLRAKEGDLAGLTREKTIGQLSGIRWKQNARGQIVIESKDDARKRGVKSPDEAEAVMLAFGETGVGVLGVVDYYASEHAKRVAEFDKLVGKVEIAKVATADNTIRCKFCESILVSMRGDWRHCNQCGKDWTDVEQPSLPRGGGRTTDTIKAGGRLR